MFLVLQRRNFDQVDRFDIERQSFLFQRGVRRANGLLTLTDNFLVVGRGGFLNQTREIVRRIFDPIDSVSRRRRTEFRLRRNFRSSLDRLELVVGRASRRFQLFFDDFAQHVRCELGLLVEDSGADRRATVRPTARLMVDAIVHLNELFDVLRQFQIGETVRRRRFFRHDGERALDELQIGILPIGLDVVENGHVDLVHDFARRRSAGVELRLLELFAAEIEKLVVGDDRAK